MNTSPASRNRTKVVCTVGPSCDTVETLTAMARAGMNVARLNFSHGDHESHARLIRAIREVEKTTGEPIAILQDLQGPKIRVGVLPESGVELKKGGTIIFDTAAEAYREGVFPVDFHELHTCVKAGERLLLNDGKYETRIVRVDDTRIETEVISGGVLTSHKGINLPDSTVTVRALGEKDKEDAKFGIAQGVDWMALSFVQSDDDIRDLRMHIVACEKEFGEEPPVSVKIIAKIERRVAIEHLDAIISSADGVMVARGDLGVEISAAKVPILQKEIIEKAMSKARPVIVATQMLDSMTDNPRPTRAEVSDVANAVIDHADAVMLSNETASGHFPVAAVQMMSDIIRETEQSRYDDFHIREHSDEHEKIDDVMAELSKLLAERVAARGILAASITGDTGRIVSRYRPELPIFLACRDVRVLHQLNLSWGIRPFLCPLPKTVDAFFTAACKELVSLGSIASDDELIVLAGEPVGSAKHVNILEVRRAI